MIPDSAYIEIKHAYLKARQRRDPDRFRLFTLVKKMWLLLDQEQRSRLQDWSPASFKPCKVEPRLGNV